jgi:pyruvate/2-oxoglutarate dehydrogenase complex dihydrolipoamide dehydrogenase (E3) component
MEHTYDFDLAVIGSGPGGQKAAIMAAKLGHRVCVVDSKSMVGGVCVNTGTIPSKTLREAVLYLTGMQLRDLYGASYRVKEEITISDLLARLQHVVGRETEVIRWIPRPSHAVGQYRRLRLTSDADRRQGRYRHRYSPRSASQCGFRWRTGT